MYAEGGWVMLAEHRARRRLAAQAREEARGARGGRAPRLPRLPLGAAAEGRARAHPAEVDQADQRAAHRPQGQPAPRLPRLRRQRLGELLQAGGAQGHRLCALLLPLASCASGASSAPWVESATPSTRATSRLHRRRQQLPRQLVQGAPSVPGCASVPSPPCAPAPLRRPGTTAPLRPPQPPRPRPRRVHCGHTQVPWDDLRYLFGEIMYGGHITDN